MDRDHGGLRRNEPCFALRQMILDPDRQVSAWKLAYGLLCFAELTFIMIHVCAPASYGALDAFSLFAVPIVLGLFGVALLTTLWLRRLISAWVVPWAMSNAPFHLLLLLVVAL